MSLEDRMTDMKNRKSFEMYLEEIQEGAILLENVLLLFVKIAELKKINDMSGRQMGDETVIRTARSIQSAERSVLEQQAVSFRVDGGEFAIIAKDTGRMGAFYKKRDGRRMWKQTACAAEVRV